MSFKKPAKITVLVISLFAILILSLICFAGCAKNENYEGQFKVTYELEGGKFQNCDYLKHYYDFKEGSSRLIADPELLTKKEFTREGYTLEGWYRTKTVSGEITVYSDKWDFSKDKVSGEELTLYAHWCKNVKLAYNVCYRGDDGKLVVINSYDADEGAKFNDILNYANMREGYTAIGYMDEEGNPWDFDFTHPGGEEDLAINVVVNYVKGEFVLVSTAEELIANRRSAIYLLNDINFGGKDFAGFGNYNKVFRGNGHTISNFNLTYGAGRGDLSTDPDLNEEGGSLCISLFGSANNAEISGVKFKDVNVNVSTGLSTTKKIIVAPICVKMTNSSVSGVSFEGTFNYGSFPKNFNKEENLIAVTENAYYFKDDASKIENFECTVEINN